jgi:hypothetical protein
MRSKVATEAKTSDALRPQTEEVRLKSHTLEKLHASPTLSREDVTLEYPEFQMHVPELIELLRRGVEARPATPRGDTFSVVGPSHDFWIQPYIEKDPPHRVIKVHILGCSKEQSGSV